MNESPREAREHFASRLKGWVRFRPRMCFFVFCFCFLKNYHYDLSLRPRKTQRVNSTTPRSRRFLKSFPIFSNWRHVFRRLCPIRGPFIALRQCRRRVNSTTPRSRFLQRLPNLQQCRRWSKHSDFVFKTTMGFSPTLY